MKRVSCINNYAQLLLNVKNSYKIFGLNGNFVIRHIDIRVLFFVFKYKDNCAHMY